PECEVVTCDPPAGIPNGLFSPVKDVYNYREVVWYSCKKDFTLSGSKSVACSEDGTFTPGPPQCTGEFANGEWVSGSRPPYKYLATVTYRCNAGYKMEGKDTMELNENTSIDVTRFKTKCESLFPSKIKPLTRCTVDRVVPHRPAKFPDVVDVPACCVLIRSTACQQRLINEGQRVFSLVLHDYRIKVMDLSRFEWVKMASRDFNSILCCFSSSPLSFRVCFSNIVSLSSFVFAGKPYPESTGRIKLTSFSTNFLYFP
uniref:Sushi domain-containing protein n=1 Tax=Takifugu rubripes TaxID=31033 RepID=A0A674NZS2_TAKRU